MCGPCSGIIGYRGAKNLCWRQTLVINIWHVLSESHGRLKMVSMLTRSCCFVHSLSVSRLPGTASLDGSMTPSRARRNCALLLRPALRVSAPPPSCGSAVALAVPPKKQRLSLGAAALAV